MKKHQYHNCRICEQYKANEKFSGKGHAKHICKACDKRGNKPPEIIEAPIELVEIEEIDETPMDVDTSYFMYLYDDNKPKKKKKTKK